MRPAHRELQRSESRRRIGHYYDARTMLAVLHHNNHNARSACDHNNYRESMRNRMRLEVVGSR